MLAVGERVVMAQFTFRCPSTGYIVHIAIEQIEAAADTIEVQCAACKGSHAIDIESGEVVPLLDKGQGLRPRRVRWPESIPGKADRGVDSHLNIRLE
jgi:hypothetical protein